MIIRNSLLLLEQLTEIENEISKVEKVLDDLGIKNDRERLIQIILAKKRMMSSGQNKH